MESPILYAFNTVGPIFFLVSLGYLFRKIGFLDGLFIKQINRLLFNCILPVYLFITIASSTLTDILDPELLLVAFLATGGITLFSYLVAVIWIQEIRERGPFVQAAVRGNLSFMGLALVSNALGPKGVALAAPLIAIFIPYNNILSIVVLSHFSGGAKRIGVKEQLLAIVKNPLIIGITMGILWSLSGITMPIVLYRSLEILSRPSLPLALLGIGGSLSLQVRKEDVLQLGGVFIIKNILFPALVVLLALLWKLDMQSIIVLFILMGSSTAFAAFIITGGMGYNTRFTASAIMITTFGSILTIGAGLFLIQTFLQ